MANNSGFGGCLRDSLGSWILGFMGHGGDESVLGMELVVIMHGLRLTWEHGFQQALCLSDSLVAITLIRNPPQVSGDHSGPSPEELGGACSPHPS